MPGPTHLCHKQQGLRAKTDRLDALTIARVLLRGEERAGSIPSDQMATSRERVRVHAQLSEEAAGSQNPIPALGVVLFPAFTQIVAEPCLPRARAVLKAYPDAQSVAHTGVEAISQMLRAVPKPQYGRPPAKTLVAAAQASGRMPEWSCLERLASFRILCEQREHPQSNRKRLEEELEPRVTTDSETRGLRQRPERGVETGAVVRAE